MTKTATEYWRRMANLERANLFCDRLNQMLEADPNALYALVEHRVPCNTKIEHETTAVPFVPASGEQQLGLLGVLNGMLDDWRLVGHYTDSDTLTHFTLLELREPDGQPTVQSPDGSELRATAEGSETTCRKSK